MTRETTEERTRQRWKKALDLFDEAFLLAPTERERLLNSAGEQDPELRPLLNDLFSASRDAETGGFLESPAWSYQPMETNPQAMVGRYIGAYRLTQYLARGGMGTVYLAERADKVFRRQVAIKFISAGTGGKHYNRFRREVQILADLKHPNLVLLYDAGRLGDGRPYIVMEYVEGENLREWAERRGPVPPPLVVEIIKQASAGLHAAHQAGVIHRDIKPANIAIANGYSNTGRLTIKVLDFGVAARKEHGDSGVSTTQGAIGTLLYMSPEQLQPIKGEDLTPASDVYALGLTAYELLTGTPANDGQSQGEIILKHLQETPEPPSHRRPDLNIPRSFDRAILKALAKDPDDRYQSALEFAAALEEIFKRPTMAWDKSTEDLQDQRPDSEPARAQPSPRPEPPASHIAPIQPDKAKIPANKTKAVWTAAAVIAAAVSIGAYHFWPVAPPSIAPSTSPPAGVRLNLGIERPKDAAFSGCRFALFKPEVIARPAAFSPDNALVILEEVGSDSISKIIKETPVPPGSYLASLDCNGFKPFTERVTIAENPQRPGWATVPLRLDPK